jgi:predicted tellurium resistance membrane protein TerC
MFDWIFLPEAWLALATLTALEIVLGIDNIIFLTILVGRLPEHQRQRGRVIGLALAMGTRIALLLSLAWLMKLVAPWFIILGHEISGRDLILILGGLFLLFKAPWKSTRPWRGPRRANPPWPARPGPVLCPSWCRSPSSTSSFQPGLRHHRRRHGQTTCPSW